MRGNMHPELLGVEDKRLDVDVDIDIDKEVPRYRVPRRRKMLSKVE